MTPPPARIPPPSEDDIPRPVPGPDVPPAVDIETSLIVPDDELEEAFEEDLPTLVARVCPGCGGEFLELENATAAPCTHAEAWGQHGGACRGTKDPTGWAWCKGPVGEGRLRIEVTGAEVYFRDRRREHAAVEIERRKR